MVTFPWKELPDFHIFSHHVRMSALQLRMREDQGGVQNWR